MDRAFRLALADALNQAVGTPQALSGWLQQRVGGLNVHSILSAGEPLENQIMELLEWAEANGAERDLLNGLVNHPPADSRKIVLLIYAYTNGEVKAVNSALAPVPAHLELFATNRPFANRTQFRTQMATLDAAGPGANSILVIEGPKLSGKSHSIRFARQCGAQNRAMWIDFDDWGANSIDARDLARAIYKYSAADLPQYDETKEDAAVPRLMTWLTGKLSDGRPTWILFDHCRRPNLSNGATALLTLFVGNVERGDLPNVRVIIADIDWKNLPKNLRKGAGGLRTDTADLPDRTAIQDWCATLANRLGKTCNADALTAYVDSVFEGVADSAQRAQLARVLEGRLSTVYQKLQGL